MKAYLYDSWLKINADSTNINVGSLPTLVKSTKVMSMLSPLDLFNYYYFFNYFAFHRISQHLAFVFYLPRLYPQHTEKTL